MESIVYSLWHNPRLLPLLHTPEFVVAKLRTGADLMTPGLANGPPYPQGAKKGAMVAVASLERPSVPLVVGVCEVDVSSLQSVVGAKGHAVRTVTWYGDELWAWGASGRKGIEPPESIEAWASDGVDLAAVGVQQLDLGEDATGDKPADAAGPSSLDDDAEDEADQKEWTTPGMRYATRKTQLIGNRHRRCLPKCIFIRSHAVQGVGQSSTLRHRVPDKAVFCHV